MNKRINAYLNCRKENSKSAVIVLKSGTVIEGNIFKSASGEYYVFKKDGALCQPFDDGVLKVWSQKSWLYF